MALPAALRGAPALSDSRMRKTELLVALTIFARKAAQATQYNFLVYWGSDCLESRQVAGTPLLTVRANLYTLCGQTAISRKYYQLRKCAAKWPAAVLRAALA